MPVICGGWLLLGACAGWLTTLVAGLLALLLPALLVAVTLTSRVEPTSLLVTV